MEQKIRKRRSLVVLLLALAVIVAAVLVAERFSFRLDLSADGANTLSRTSRQLYKEIPEQVRITYYISPTLSDRHPGPRAVEGLVRSLAAASHGKIAVDVADPASGKKEAAVEALGVAPQRMQVVEKNEQRVALVYSGLVVQYLGRTQVLPFVLSTDTLEYDLVKAIKAAITDKKSVASILVGDSDKSIANDYNTISEVLKQSGWETKEVRPGDAVPPETTVLLVLGNSALDDYDAYRIDAYLASGGRALFAVKGVDVQVRQGLSASVLKNDALLRALESYGIKVDRELVLDQSSLTAPFQVTSPFGGQAVSYLRYPHWIMTRPEYRDAKSPLTARSAGLDLFWPSPLESLPRSGVDYSTLVKTTPKAWLQKNRFAVSPDQAEQYGAEAGSTTGQYVLAATLSGILPSAYAGKALPVRAGAAALPALPQPSRSSRILVVGSSDFANDLMTITNSTFNASFIAGAADWLSSGDDLVAIKTRGARDSRLTKVQDPDARSFMISLAYIINIGLVPILVIAFGLVRSLKRRRLAKDEAHLRTVGLSAGQGPAAAPNATVGLSAGQGPAETAGESSEGGK
ncbi:MAG: GldG family protein [Rectinemataceae bacterium]